MKAIVIRGPDSAFPQIASVIGLNVDHGQVGHIGSDKVLSAYATDEAIAEIEALGLQVDVEATEDEQQQLLAQILQEGGSDATDIGIA